MATVFGGRYRASGTVMSGGGGDVHLCHDPNLERPVAVKFLKAGVEKRRLLDEIAALQKIRSKNVVQVLDLVDDPTFGIGIVTEYLPGNDLTVVSEFPTDRTSLLSLVYKLANGLSDIHGAGIVHRDLKPNNVKFGDERVLKIFDFNLARDESKAVTVGFRGTHGFAAPEQYGGGKVQLTAAADVYALAATIAYLAHRGTLPPAFRSVPPSAQSWPGGFGSASLVDPVLVPLLNAALAAVPAARPTASEIRNVASSLLRRDAHKATITIRGNASTYQLDAKNRQAQLAHSKAGGGTVEVVYDGLGFVVRATSGPVLVNHRPCQTGQRLPDSCVIDLGSPSGSLSERLFVTFDLSHPEVVQ